MATELDPLKKKTALGAGSRLAGLDPMGNATGMDMEPTAPAPATPGLGLKNPYPGAAAVLSGGIDDVRSATAAGQYAGALGKATKATIALPFAAAVDTVRTPVKGIIAGVGAGLNAGEDFGRGLLGLADRQPGGAQPAPPAAAPASQLGLPTASAPKPAMLAPAAPNVPTSQPAGDAMGVMRGTLADLTAARPGAQVQGAASAPIAQPIAQPAALSQKIDSPAYVPESGTGLLRNDRTGAVTQFNAQPTASAAAPSAEFLRKVYGPTDYSPGRFGAVPQAERQPVVVPSFNANKPVFQAMADLTNGVAAAGTAIRANRQANTADKMALERLSETNRTGLGLRGQDIALRGQNIGAEQFGQTNALARDRFGLEKSDSERKGEGLGLENIGKRQMVDAQAAYLGAPDDTQRATALEKLQGLQGRTPKEQANRYTVVPRGTDDTGRNLGSDVLDNATGRLVDTRAGQTIANDSRATAIRDNKSLSREQKIEQLKKLGYQ